MADTWVGDRELGDCWSEHVMGSQKHDYLWAWEKLSSRKTNLEVKIHLPCREEYFSVGSSLSRHKAKDLVQWQWAIELWHAGDAFELVLVNYEWVFLLFNFGNEYWRRIRKLSVLLWRLPLGKHYPRTCQCPHGSVVRQRHACGHRPRRPSWIQPFRPRLSSSAGIHIQGYSHDPQRWLHHSSVTLWFRPWFGKWILVSGILANLLIHRLQGQLQNWSCSCSVLPRFAMAFWSWRHISSLHIVVSWQQPAGAE